jgi:putative flippase GtrA
VHLSALDANLLAYLAGHTISFSGNRRWTFHSTARPLGEYWRFWEVTAIGLALSQGVLALGLSIGFSDVPSKAAAVLVSGLWNFTLHRFWTFRNRQKTLQ